MLKFDIRCW